MHTQGEAFWLGYSKRLAEAGHLPETVSRVRCPLPKVIYFTLVGETARDQSQSDSKACQRGKNAHPNGPERTPIRMGLNLD